jgi:hypothetical protein
MSQDKAMNRNALQQAQGERVEKISCLEMKACTEYVAHLIGVV